MSDDPVLKAFSELNLEAPSDETLCIYKSGQIDSADLMQLLLEIEMETGKRLNLPALMDGDISLIRIRSAIESA